LYCCNFAFTLSIFAGLVKKINKCKPPDLDTTGIKGKLKFAIMFMVFFFEKFL